MTVLINGQLNSNIAASDRGLQYGDGLFETIAIKNGECEHWYEHMSRLTDGCQRLNIPAPDAQQLLVEAQRLCSDKERAVLKIIITRGSGGRGYRAPDMVEATRIVSIHPWPSYPAENITQGVCVFLCDTKLSYQPALASIKHLNRLEQIIARNEWDDVNISEGLMSDIDGNIVEGTMSNYFAVIDNELVTPEIVDCGVAGIMRSHIMAQAILHEISVRERKISLDELYVADELFVCNSIIGVWPVKKLVNHSYKVIGEVTAQIMDGLI
ncbi:MAG: aminodeoxychorismate lyase [Sulfuriflexus sp.]|nr:aminodeoxychorismate lyase [Sulfuriflexus sp.]